MKKQTKYKGIFVAGCALMAAGVILGFWSSADDHFYTSSQKLIVLTRLPDVAVSSVLSNGEGVELFGLKYAT
jgi:hypothetical protein